MPKKFALIILLAAAATAGTLVWLAGVGGTLAADQLDRALLPAGYVLHHEGARLTISGGLRLRSPRLLALDSDAPLLSARKLRVNAATPLAALRWLRDPDATPDAVRLRAADADTSALAALAPLQLLAGSGLVPFETLGCGALNEATAARGRDSRFHPGHNAVQLDWQRDAAPRKISIALRHTHAELGNIDLQADLMPTGRGHTYGISRLQLDHEDLGYLAWRNQTCAAAINGTAAQWIQAHLNELSGTLAQADIRLSDATLDLYRSYIEGGGKLRVSLLPDADLEWQHWWIYPRTQLFRLLNVTARLDDAPPIMVGMEFTEPQRVPAVVLDELDALAESDTEGWSAALPHVVISRVEAHGPAVEVGAAQDDAVDIIPPVTALQARSIAAARGIVDLPASTSRPAPGSDAALVWNPDRFEPLPEDSMVRPLAAISITQLASHRGARVRVLTDSGRRIEGRVDGVHDGQLLLRVLRASGHAQLKIPTAGIVQVQPLASPAAKTGD